MWLWLRLYFALAMYFGNGQHYGFIWISFRGIAFTLLLLLSWKWSGNLTCKRAAFFRALISSTWAFILHFHWSQVLPVLLLTLWNSSTVHTESQRVLKRGKTAVTSFTKLWINPQGDKFSQKKKNLSPSKKNPYCEFFSGYKLQASHCFLFPPNTTVYHNKSPPKIKNN